MHTYSHTRTNIDISHAYINAYTDAYLDPVVELIGNNQGAALSKRNVGRQVELALCRSEGPEGEHEAAVAAEHLDPAMVRA
jgi:hypothetical protein